MSFDLISSGFSALLRAGICGDMGAKQPQYVAKMG